MWSRQRFVATLIAVTAVIAVALTIALTSVALSVQTAIGNGPENSAQATPSVAPTDWATRNKFAPQPAVTATTTLPIPAASAGPEAAARNFAVNFLRGGHLKDFSDERKRWIAELSPLGDSTLPIALRESRQDWIPVATIINAKTESLVPGASVPSGASVTTFDLSDGSILLVETKRVPGGQAPWLVANYRIS